MQATAQQLAAQVHATLEGNPEQIVTDARSLLQATPEHLSFIENVNRLGELTSSKAQVIVAPVALTLPAELLSSRPLTVLRVADPLSAFLQLVSFLRGKVPNHPIGVDARAAIDPTVQFGPDCVVRAFANIGAGTRIGARCVIHPGVVIGQNCIVGDDAVLHPNTVLYDNTVLGHRVIVHSNSVIGADGFGYRYHHGKHNKIPQLGWVEIGDDVEIGAGVTIDRGTVDPTRIGAGTKIDNQVQIGHNCEIGAHNLLVSQVGIGGSCVTGKYVTIAGQVGVADHLTIGDGALVGAKAGLSRDVPPGTRVLGAPAMPEMDMKRIFICLPRLPQMVRELARIRQVLGLEELDKRAA
jgi:UDP-3-O-[3-hydroxymyristoyl] glucosamine N-acyltransferase